MKKLLFLLLFFVSLNGLGQILKNEQAEDLWGNPININDTISKKTTVIIPFSTSNCGYCLIDGYFSKQNYLIINEKLGGASFEQCLFNPQLDIYAFTKQYKTDHPILTFPPELHKIHQNGFPTILGFKNGTQVVKFHHIYADYQKLNSLLWDNKAKLQPTGNLHMAERFMFENEQKDAIFVYPDHADIDDKKDTWLFNSITHKHIGELTEGERKMHLYFRGNHDFAVLEKFFSGTENVFGFSDNHIELGNYRFRYDSIGIFAWAINPYNTEKYIVFSINNGNKRFGVYNDLDYLIFSGNDSASFKRLMYGHYEYIDGNLRIPNQKMFSDVSIQKYCARVCEVASDHFPEPKELSDEPTISFEERSMGIIATFGRENCRFPDIASDSEGNVWAVFEENGDIVLNKVEDNSPPIYIEYDSSDSYNPVVACQNNRVYVFYLNDKDSYYRVYGRFYEEGFLSDEFLVSEVDPFNACLLSVASNHDEISISWTEWKANQRFLKLSKMVEGSLTELMNIPLAPPEYLNYDYNNAWYSSMSYDAKGDLWGAWNQHYPGDFCIIGGIIGEVPIPITNTAKKMESWERGGYPTITTKDGKIILAYESYGWDVLRNRPQTIKYREFNQTLNKWSVPLNISDNKATFYNQTPSIICDSHNNTYLVWSGRSNITNSVWGVYVSVNESGKWSAPSLISKSNENARHPKVIVNKADNSIWVSWHVGVGENMKVEAIRLEKEQLKPTAPMPNSR